MAQSEENKSFDDYKSPKFDQEEYVGCFRDVIKMNFSEVEECYVYRTCISLPCCKTDQTPVILRKKDNTIESVSRKLSDEEIANMTDKRKLKTICSYALSVNDTAENSKVAAKSQYDKLKNQGKPKDELDVYADSRGRNIGKFKITPEVGLLTAFKNGHANLLIYEGVDIENYRVKDFVDTVDYENDADK